MLVKSVDSAERSHRHADGSWLENLPACSMAQYRKKIREGAEPFFVLDKDSSYLKPIWLLLLKEQNASLIRITTPGTHLPAS